jgi:hypothetical protein
VEQVASLLPQHTHPDHPDSTTRAIWYRSRGITGEKQGYEKQKMEKRKPMCVGNLVSLILQSKRFGKTTKITSAFEQNESRIKRLRKPERSNVDEEPLKWSEQQRSDSVQMGGPFLMTKAEEFAKKLSDEEFACTAGWIDRFKLRHNIFFGKVRGEGRCVNSVMTTEWLTAVWASVCEGHAKNSNIFNADETGIFSRLTLTGY